jgi:mxaA protein
VLVRQVNILAKTDEPITPKSLPIKGTRVAGMELSEVNLSQEVKKSETRYMLELRYQVFAHATQAAEMQLPQETITIIDGEELQLPAWKFWYSPLVNSDLESAKTTILPQAKASLIDQNSRLMRLLAFAGLFLLGAIGLVYINADRYLLPFMGGNFSRAHRKVKTIAKKRASEANAPKDALAHLHEAFNQQFGRGLYPNKIDAFLASHPAFNKLKMEITAFFDLSNQTQFGDAPKDNAQVMEKILSFSKQLRDCERGV